MNDECPAWADGKHMFFYPPLTPRPFPLDGSNKFCICGARVGLTAEGKELLEKFREEQRRSAGPF